MGVSSAYIGEIFWCVYAHARNKHESPQWGSCRIYSIGNRVMCVCEREEERERDRESGCEGQVLPCTVGHSLTFHCFHFSLSPPFFPFTLFPNCNLLLFSGGGLVSPWPVGTEKQPQWLEDCSSTTTRGRSSSPGSTEMTLGRFHRSTPKFWADFMSTRGVINQQRWTGWDWFWRDQRGLCPSSWLSSLHLSVVLSPLKCV